MKILTILSFAFLAFVFGCKTTTTTSPELTGDLKGTVALFDSHGNLVAVKSGVLVQAEGTSLSGISDTGGNWIIHNLPTETYSISFSKAGYGTMKNTSFSFVGGGTVIYDATVNNPLGNPMYLSQPVTFTVTLDSVSAPGPEINKNTGRIFGHLNGADLADSLKIEVDTYFGPTQDSLQVGVARFGNGYNYPLSKNGSNLVFKINNFDGNGLAITSGETLYFQATAYIRSSYYNGSSYLDVKTGKTIWANLPPSSNVLSSNVP